MRNLVMVSSVIMMITGVFCIANSTVAFTSIVFVIGIAILLLGVCEIAVVRLHMLNTVDEEYTVNIEGVLALILAVVLLSNQITDNNAVVAVFALWAVVEGLMMISKAAFKFRIKENSSSANFDLLIAATLVLFGLYMFYNDRAFQFPLVGMIGIAIFLIGVKRLKAATDINYRKPTIITSNEEKLAKAQRDKKRAMKKAKEGIREAKIAQEKISKINQEIAKEISLKNQIEETRREMKLEEEQA